MPIVIKQRIILTENKLDKIRSRCKECINIDSKVRYSISYKLCYSIDKIDSKIEYNQNKNESCTKCRDVKNIDQCANLV